MVIASFATIIRLLKKSTLITGGMNYQVIDYSPTRYILQVCICCRSPVLVRYKLKPTVLEAEVMKVEGLSGAFGGVCVCGGGGG